MSVKKPTGKTGSASIDKQGHTTTGQYGSNPSPNQPTRKAPRDLNLR